ncbi:hypothetical protein DENSPDRAFT_930213 [Dentipellis sp. KUC8613]|nr:hypothetical protein DENSPDRAFT_930213 [Dentipellis sp. KUC8613]
MVTSPSREHIFNSAHHDHILAQLAITLPVSRVDIWEEEELQEHLHSHDYGWDIDGQWLVTIEWNYGNRLKIRLYVQIQTSFDVDLETFSYGYRDTRYYRFYPRFPPAPAAVLDADFQFQSRTIYGVPSPSPSPPPLPRALSPVEDNTARYTPSLGSSSPYRPASPVVVPPQSTTPETIDPSDPRHISDPLPPGFTYDDFQRNNQFDQWYFSDTYTDLELADFDVAAEEYRCLHPSIPPSANVLPPPDQSPEAPRANPIRIPTGISFNAVTRKYYAWKRGVTGTFTRTVVAWRPQLSAKGDDWFWESTNVFLTADEFVASMEEEEHLAVLQQQRARSLRPPTPPIAPPPQPTTPAPTPRPHPLPRVIPPPPGLFTPVKPAPPPPAHTMSSTNPTQTTTATTTPTNSETSEEWAGKRQVLIHL